MCEVFIDQEVANWDSGVVPYLEYFSTRWAVSKAFACKLQLAKIDLASRHDPQILEGLDAPPGQEHPPVVIHDHRHNRGDDVFFLEAFFCQSLLLPVGLHQRPDTQPQGVDLDETLGIGLVEHLILLEGGEVEVKERVGL